MSLADGKYVALTTDKRDGSSSTVPVWIAEVGDDRLGFTTGATSLKARRWRTIRSCSSNPAMPGARSPRAPTR